MKKDDLTVGPMALHFRRLAIPAYQAVSGTIIGGTYDTEAALDGYDAKLTANLPYFYSSNLYGKVSNWKDAASYED